MKIFQILEDRPWDNFIQRILLGLVRIWVGVIVSITLFYLGMFIANIIVIVLSIPTNVLECFFAMGSVNLFWDFVGSAIGGGWSYFLLSILVYAIVYDNINKNIYERIIIFALSAAFIISIYDIRLDLPYPYWEHIRDYLIKTFGCTIWKTFDFIYTWKTSVSNGRFFVFDLSVIAGGIYSLFVDRSK